MAEVKRSWDLLSDEYRKKSINEIIHFFQEEVETDEEIGIIAAGNILNHFLQTVGVHLYNKGVEDSIAFFKDRIDALELDMDALVKK